MSESDIVAAVIDAPAYQERCTILFELFQKSREAKLDPVKILEVQEGIYACIDTFQDDKALFKKNNDEIRRAIAKRLILISKQIMDAIVWRVCNYDRVTIQQLSGHPRTGNIDSTSINDLLLARKIVEEDGEIAIVNDLTNTVRYGDLTVIGKNGNYILETKYGKATAKNRRSKRQKRGLEELFKFINFGIRTREGERVIVFRADCEIKTYHNALKAAIREVKKKGYCQVYFDDCLALRIAHMDIERDEYPIPQKMWLTPRQLTLTNWDLFFDAKARTVPYGIFPLDDHDCFDLMTGNLLVLASINFDALQLQYKKAGLNLELPNLSQEEIDFYLRAEIAERKKLMHKGRLILRTGRDEFPITPDYFNRVSIELLDVETIVKADKQLVDIISEVYIPDDLKTLFYCGFKSEKQIWK